MCACTLHAHVPDATLETLSTENENGNGDVKPACGLGRESYVS